MVKRKKERQFQLERRQLELKKLKDYVASHEGSTEDRQYFNNFYYLFLALGTEEGHIEGKNASLAIENTEKTIRESFLNEWNEFVEENPDLIEKIFVALNDVFKEDTGWDILNPLLAKAAALLIKQGVTLEQLRQ